MDSSLTRADALTPHPDEPVIEGSVTGENCVPHARTWRYIRARCRLHSSSSDTHCGYPFCRCPVAEAA